MTTWSSRQVNFILSRWRCDRHQAVGIFGRNAPSGLHCLILAGLRATSSGGAGLNGRAHPPKGNLSLVCYSSGARVREKESCERERERDGEREPPQCPPVSHSAACHHPPPDGGNNSPVTPERLGGRLPDEGKGAPQGWAEMSWPTSAAGFGTLSEDEMEEEKTVSSGPLLPPTPTSHSSKAHTHAHHHTSTT